MKMVKSSRETQAGRDGQPETDISAKPTARLPRSYEPFVGNLVYGVKKRRLKVALTQVRFLLSKVWHTGEWLSDGEEIILTERLLQLQSFREFHWLRRNASMVSLLTKMYSAYARNHSKQSCRGVQLLLDIIDPNRKVLFQGCQYYGLLNQTNVMEDLRRINLARKTRLPPRRVVGVGYRDHGTYRDTSKAGCPSWQEIAASQHSLDSQSSDRPDRWETIRLRITIEGWETVLADPQKDLRDATYTAS